MSGARVVLEKALALSRNWRAHIISTRAFFATMATTPEPAHQLRLVLEQYPRDRVVRNDLGRMLFLQRKYAEAVREFSSKRWPSIPRTCRRITT